MIKFFAAFPKKLLVLQALLVFCSLANAQEGETLKLSPPNPDAFKVPSCIASSSKTSAINLDNTHKFKPLPSNDNFSSAINILVGTTLTAQTTDGGTLEAGENVDCNSTAATSIWYSFTVGAITTLYVNTSLDAGADYVGTAVWNTSSLPTGNCPAMQCQSSEFGPDQFTEQLTGLVTGQTYYIQIVSINNTDANSISIGVTTAAPGGGYQLTNPMPASASSTCGTAYSACYINSCNPSTSTVTTAGCTTQSVSLTSNAVYTTCYTFTNGSSNAEIGIQSYLTSNCANACNGNGNVNWMDWTLYNSSCNLIACGNLSNVEVTGAGCSQTYTVCQTFEVTTAIVSIPFTCGCCAFTSCTVTGVQPYADWASCTSSACTVLPIELSTFSVEYQQESNTADIYWSTATEVNNKLFTIEKSLDGMDGWKVVATQAGAGTSSEMKYYTAVDEEPYPGLSYYRLKQTDFDGNSMYFNVVPLNIPAMYTANLFPNPTSGNMTLKYTTQSPDPVVIKISDLSGKQLSCYTISQVQQGVNNFNISTENLAPGMYFMQVCNPQKTFNLKFIKQ